MAREDLFDQRTARARHPEDEDWRRRRTPGLCFVANQSRSENCSDAFDIIRIDGKRFLAICTSILGTAKEEQQVAEFVICLDVIRLDRDCLLIMGDGLIVPADRSQSVAEAVVSFGIFRPEPQRLAALID